LWKKGKNFPSKNQKRKNTDVILSYGMRKINVKKRFLKNRYVIISEIVLRERRENETRSKILFSFRKISAYFQEKVFCICFCCI